MNMIMKKLAVLLLLASAPAMSFAQGRSPIRFGLKAGGNLSHMTISDNNGNNYGSSSFGFGYFGGGLMEISGPAGSKFKGQIEALYNRHTYKNNYLAIGSTSIDQTTKLHQITVPVMVKYFVIPSLSFNLGAAANFNVGAKAKTETTFDNTTTTSTTDFKDNDYLQTVQIGALAGVSYYIYKGLFIDGRYNYTFGKMLDQKNNTDPAYKNASTIQLGVGYKF
jgi:hypothetical protein